MLVLDLLFTKQLIQIVIVLAVPKVMVSIDGLYAGACALNPTSVDNDLSANAHLVIEIFT